MTPVIHGTPHFLAVHDSNLDHTAYNFAVDGNPGVYPTVYDALDALVADTEEYGGEACVYICVPIAKVALGKVVERKQGIEAMLAVVNAAKDLLA